MGLVRRGRVVKKPIRFDKFQHASAAIEAQEIVANDRISFQGDIQEVNSSGYTGFPYTSSGSNQTADTIRFLSKNGTIYKTIVATVRWFASDLISDPNTLIVDIETSTDGITWTQRASVTYPIATTNSTFSSVNFKITDVNNEELQFRQRFRASAAVTEPVTIQPMSIVLCSQLG